jgi:hypothetical protein
MGRRPGEQGDFAKHPDGRYKVNMKVPLLLDQPTPEFPTGIAVWYVKGNERSELLRAMQAAGIEKPGPPRGGDRIDITYTHDEPSRSGFNPRKVKYVVYTAGNGVLPQLPQAQLAANPQLNAPVWNAPPAQYAPYGGPGPSAMVQGPGGGTVPTGPGGYPQQPVPVQYAQQLPPGGYGQGQTVMQSYPQQPGFPAPAAAGTYAGSAPQTTPPAFQGTYPPEYSAGYGQQHDYQQAPPTGPGAPQGAPTGSTPGAQPTAPASPSSAPGGPPPGWPADVPFIPGLTPDQARIAATMHHPAAQPQ